MQEYFEKIKERLEKETDKWNDIYLKERQNGRIDHYADGMSDAFQEAIEIVDQVAEEYGHRDDRWIPCDIKTPKYEVYTLASLWVTMRRKGHKYCYVSRLKWNGYQGRWEHDNGKKVTDKYEIIAWKWINRPAPYQPKGE